MPSTTSPDQVDAPRVARAPKLPEFVALMASLMALTALSIDIMLPALPLIRDSFGVVDPNAQQLVITLYMVGFGVGQLFYGTLSDRFGRKVVLGAGLAVYAAAAILCLVAPSFEVLLAARLLQGMSNAAPRVVAIAVVRDLYGGRRMAEVMSFVMTVFIIVPALAPALGSAILLFGDWHDIFLFLGVVALAILFWTGIRLPETRPRELREPLSLKWVGAAFRQVVTTRQTIGYTLATGVAFGGMMAYVNSAEQVYNEVYRSGAWFTALFALVALAMAGAAVTNARLVGRLGMRKIGHTALICYAAVGGAHMALEMLPGVLPLPVFMAMMMLQLYCFGLIMPNFNAISMEPQGRIAGTASSFVGCATTGIAAFLGWLVGQSYDGTALPLAAGYFIFGTAALIMVLVVERGRLWGSSQ
ncbi:multidrug effflux MFS transporter [uncultured Albimonas sp.]|uniref:multidrug effflux MFS transporter n=1 Tax=uncultured Albimonas sp. TaxID=1331701 RepID=UPI0030ED13C0|tara:strand:- start:493 stop:1740 length:1248 start_codon:yes stop_codon:yes gene_type:complete